MLKVIGRKRPVNIQSEQAIGEIRRGPRAIQPTTRPVSQRQTDHFTHSYAKQRAETATKRVTGRLCQCDQSESRFGHETRVGEIQIKAARRKDEQQSDK